MNINRSYKKTNIHTKYNDYKLQVIVAITTHHIIFVKQVNERLTEYI